MKSIKILKNIVIKILYRKIIKYLILYRIKSMEGDNLPVSKQNFYFVCIGFSSHTFFYQ